MKMFLFLFFLLELFYCYGQEINARFVLHPEYSEFKGMIGDKYPITMIIYPVQGFAYGFYYYDKIKKPISLRGKIDYIYGFINNCYYEKETLELFEYDQNNNINATFRGEILNKSIFKGIWEGNGKDLPFELKRTSFNYISSVYNYIFEVKIDSSVYAFDFSKNFEYEPKIDTYLYKKIDEKYYLLFSVSYFSKGVCVYQGNCGCGLESFLLYLTIDKKANLKSQQILYYESCLYGVNSIFEKDGSRLFSISDVDFNNFKNLFLETSYPREGKEMRYLLNSECLECGFQLVSSKYIDY